MDYKSLEELIIREGLETGIRRHEGLPVAAQTLGFNDIQCLPNINRLKILKISDCPTLSSFPEDGLPTTLISLWISSCGGLELPHEMLAKLTSLGRLSIINSCDSMRSFPLGIFPKLASLYFWDCKNLESFSLIEGVVENLSRLSIARCPNLVCFPHGGLCAPNLTELEVQTCDKLKSLPERIHTLTHLRNLEIRDLPNLESIAEDGGLPHNLGYFSIQNCERLRASSVAEYWGLQGLVSLEKYEISGRGSDEILEALLKQQLLPTTLQRLEISQLSSLKSLDAKDLNTSLLFLF